MKYSIIIVVNEENPALPEYVAMIEDVCAGTGEPFEILLIANATENFLKSQMRRINFTANSIRAFALHKRASQAACLRCGLKESTGEIILACGSYQELTRGSFLSLLECQGDKVDMAVPRRVNRPDSYLSRLHSRLFNFMVRKITGVDFNDIGCNTKLFRREVAENLDIYGNMDRYLPIIAYNKGYRVKEVDSEYYEGYRGKTAYTPAAYLFRLIDMITLFFNMRYSRKPLRFFSLLGFIFMCIGSLLMVFIFGELFFWDTPIGNRPLLVVGLMAIALGAQVTSIGLIGEIIAFAYGRAKPEYNIEKVI
jgi:hypothetical protein